MQDKTFNVKHIIKL